jgi:hypothetical protein
MKLFEQFALKKLKLAGGEETHRFEAILVLIKSSGDRVPAAHVSNGGTGGPNMYYAIAPITDAWINDTLEPFAQRALIEHYTSHPDQCPPSYRGGDPLKETIDLLSGRYGSSLDWLVNELIEENYRKKDRAKRERALKSGKKLGGFGAGDKVYVEVARKRVKAKVIKVNRKTLGIEILEPAGKFPAGAEFRGPPSLCEKA